LGQGERPSFAEPRQAAAISVHDVLTMPGRTIRLEAQLFQPGVLGKAGIGGELVEFLVGGRAVARAMTGGDGTARIEYAPPQRGILPVTVRLVPSKRLSAATDGSGTLCVWEKRRPILLVEVTALTEEPQSPSMPLPSLPITIGGTTPLKPVPDAADELKRLSQFYYNIIYLTKEQSGPAMFRGDQIDLRRWLTQHQFPEGHWLRVPGGPAALTEALESLKENGWDNLKAGVGSSREFAETLVARRITVVIVREQERGELPRKARVAKEWRGVRKLL
jgi:hypothetical protein